MVSYRRLESAVEAALSGSPPQPQERTELFHLLHLCRPDFQAFLHCPEPKATDRTEVLSKEVRLPDAPPTVLDDQDVQIALKLSDDYHLNEIDCVSLLVAAHQEWNLMGRDPVETLRLAAGLWFTERRALINSLQLLFRAVVLDEELDSDFVADIRQYLDDLINAGLRKRLLTLVKELGREDPSGLGGPGVEPYVMDSRGALVQRREVSLRERLSICQCLVYSCLTVRINAQEAKELCSLVKACAADLSSSQENIKLQITYTLMFSLLIALVSDALGGAHEMGSLLTPDAQFRREFHTQVMEVGMESVTKGYTDVLRLVWGVFLMCNTDQTRSGSQSSVSDSRACLDHACEQDVFKFLTLKVIKTAAFENDDTDLVYIYTAYLHKMFMIFLSNSVGREKIKEMKDVATIAESYPSDEPMEDELRAQRQAVQAQADPFISLLELLSEIYQKEPDHVAENEVLWNFVRFIGEDHTSYVTLVAFLKLLTALGSSEEGARRVHQMLQNRTYRSVSWYTLFNSLTVYEEHFRHCLQTSGSLLPPFQEGDAKALNAYLQVLKKVVECGNEVEKTTWFPDIEPLFKLLPFENVPPYLKGSLRNAIAAFVPLSPVMKDRVWSLLDAYDLPLASGATIGASVQQVYDLSFELNEVEARQEEYHSTLSYLNLLNVLIANESDTSDKGHRYAAIFKFVRDQVFGPYSQRVYADPLQKWQLVVASLRHFHMMLTAYDLSEDVLVSFLDQGVELSLGPNKAQLPVIEIMKDFMSGKIIFRGVMSILMLGAEAVLEERSSKIYGPVLEEAVQLSLELILIVLQKDNLFADHWRPIFQTLDTILSHDSRQLITIVQYIHYDASATIQQHAIKITDVFSSRLPHLVSLIVDAGSATNLIEDYSACLEVRTQDSQASDSGKDDTGSLILRLLLNNLSRPAPNLTHLLLKFDVDQPVERTILQPKRFFSCLRVILDMLESRERPSVNYSLHELGFQLMYELCVDELTSGPTLELMRTEKYDFFSHHLEFACEPLPSREVSQALRISSLQQRAWLLKLLAVNLHMSDMDILSHRRSSRRLVERLFTNASIEAPELGSNQVPLLLANGSTDGLQKTKVLELLDVLQFPLPESHSDLPAELEIHKEELKVDEILNNPTMVDAGGVYTLSERGDRIIDLAALRDKLWQAYKRLEIQYNLLANERRQAALREAVQKLLRWAWKRNKFLEEQASQLHMLVGWTQLVEITLSRRFEFLKNHLQVLYDLLDAALDANTSPDCSLNMALVLSQIVLTAISKLQEQSFSSPGDVDYSDEVTYADLLSSVRIPNSACQTVLSKLVAAILRSDSSEALRRRQFAALLSYFHYCQGMVTSDLSLSVVRSLLIESQDGEEDAELSKLEGNQAELCQLNFTIIKQDATAFLDLVVKDAVHGSEVGKAIAFYVLEAILALDRGQLFFGQLQSRGLLSSCFTDISTNSYQALVLPSRDMTRRLYTLEAELSLLLRVCFHSKKRGAQALYAMGAIQHLSSCKAIDVQLTEDGKKDALSKAGAGVLSQHDRQLQIVIPILRLILCFTSLIDTTKTEGSDDVTLEILEFVKLHHGLVDRVLRDDGAKVNLADLEELQLVTAILAKVWPFEESESFGFKQGMFNLAYIYFSVDSESRSKYIQLVRVQQRNLEVSAEEAKKMELFITRLRLNLISYIHTLVSKQGLRLHLSGNDNTDITSKHYTLGRQRQPSLKLVSSLLEQVTLDLETSVEEKILIVAKLPDINELTRQEVEAIAAFYGAPKAISESESLRKRRYMAMVEMCSAAGTRESQINYLLVIVEQALEILYLHVEAVQEPHAVGMEESIQARKTELDALGHKLLPSFEKLEGLKEEKAGQSVKHIHRLVHSLKSQTLRGFA